jgi:Uma2 family endonuclease
MKEESVKQYSIEDYLALERVAEHKSEYEAGKVVAMSGGTINHGIIGNNINTELNIALKGKKSCITINGDVRIWIEKAKSFVYPDAMVICGEIETYENDQNSIINPILVVEVLSKSTESYDRGDKFHKYCSLPSFKEYVLIDQNKPVIDVLYKEDSSYWKMTTAIGLDKSITLNSIGITLKLEDIYQNIGHLDVPPFQLDL